MLLAMNMELDRHPHPELEGMDLYLGGMDLLYQRLDQ